MEKFSCYIIGDDYLLIECGKFLLQKGCVILGVFSSYENAVDWANHEMIPVFQNMKQFENGMSGVEFDYLFSISNRRILPISVLNKAKKLSVNYHNAPLPKYPGVYATTWAILNDEKEHGITWHTITEAIDGGDILIQEKFPIRADDTMLTLNTRCHERALILFKKLVDDLLNGNVVPKKQTGKERYYSLKDKVSGDALIFWNQPAEVIYRLYRALYSYPKVNHIGFPVFMLENEAFIPCEIGMTQDFSKSVPGVVTDLNVNYIQIATTTTDIRIYKIMNIDGIRLSIEDLVNKYQIENGYILRTPSAKIARYLEQFSKDNYRNELYWVKELQACYPVQTITFPVSTRKTLSSVLFYTYSPSSKIKRRIQELCDSSQLNITDFLITLLLICIYRINNYEHFTIGFSTAFLRSTIFKVSQFYSSYVPYTIDFDPAGKSIKELCSIIAQDIFAFKERSSYKRDIFMRFPELSKNQRFLGINVLIAKTKKDIEPQQNTLTIAILEENKEFVFIGNKIGCTQTTFKKNVRYIVTHLDALLSSSLKSPEKLAIELSMLTKRDLSFFQNEFRGDVLNAKKTELIPSLFETQVSKAANHIAISFEDADLTYFELNMFANNIAHYLIKKNVISGQVVAVCLENTKILISCMLALMKIGAIYMPLDPGYPTNQLSFMLEDTEANILLTSSKLVTNFSWYTGERIQIDTEWDQITRGHCGNPKRPIRNDDIAYIIYTSGSTGKPKGVLVSHANIANSLLARVQYYKQYIGNSLSINFLLLLSTSFDTSMGGILWPLIIGAKLVLLPTYEIKNINKIVEVIEHRQVTHIMCVPALYSQILSSAQPNELHSLRSIILGGDYWDIKLVRAHRKAIPRAHLFNEYGVTEATIWSTVKLIYNGTTGKYVNISIGWPIPNTQIYILDKYLQPVPVGIEGELFLGGENVTQGYLNRPKLTEERFIKYKNMQGKEIILYKTGDVCNYSPNSGFNFRGRNDHQVKIRGIRIELPQIEKQLLQYSQLKQCVVVDREINNEKYIVAYLVPRNTNHILDLKNVRKFLSNHLPEYMIPAFFMTLNYIPLTRNNKIERKLLPMPNIKKSISENNYISPKTTTEKRIAEIWSEVLNVNNVGVESNFFTLGGHSLLISEILMSIYKVFKININMQSFLANPVISNLAKMIDGKNNNYKKSEAEFIRDSYLTQISSVIPNNICMEKPRSILLTGATGFFGSYLLQDLILYTEADIYCLIRAKNYEAAKERLQRCFTENKLDFTLLQSKRVKLLVGDLALPSLGISDSRFKRLITEIDTIYHNGALVHHLYDYNTLRAHNVLSVLELLKIATTEKPKKIHYISTFSTTVEFNERGAIKEDFLSKDVDPESLPNGYARSKWVAERLLAQAKDRGLPINIYRPTWILGDSQFGVSPIKQNHLLQAIKGCIQMGYAPDWNVELNIMPVDFVSKAVIKISLHDIRLSKVFNLQNRNTLNWKYLMSWINSYYYPVRIIDAEEWRSKHLSGIKQDNTLYPLLPFYLQKEAEMPSIIIDIEDANVRRSMEKFGIVYPSSNKDLLIKYFDYFQDIGFISQFPGKRNYKHQQLEVSHDPGKSNIAVRGKFVSHVIKD